MTSAGGVAYTWDDRGNLIGDGTFTYAYNSASRLVGAQSLAATLAYTYTADGLRVAQATNGAETRFAWDWASGVPEMLAQSCASGICNLESAIYLVGHETLGW